jgi:hypothetical protein
MFPLIGDQCHETVTSGPARQEAHRERQPLALLKPDLELLAAAIEEFRGLGMRLMKMREDDIYGRRPQWRCARAEAPCP